MITFELNFNMKKVLFLGLIGFQVLSAQNISQTLESRTKDLLAASNMISANVSFYVADENGNKVYEFNGDKGLSTASTQKIFTAVAALEKLGSQYRYKTRAGYTGKVVNGELQGDLWITSNGDPTLGSWRYEGYKPDDFKSKFLQAVADLGIRSITGNIIVDDSYFDAQSTPGGWPWNDIGNYYGAGVWGINWNENQFDINIEGATKIKSYHFEPIGLQLVNEVQPGGSGDNSIVYTAPFSPYMTINGTLPAHKNMTISGATPNPPLLVGNLVKNWLAEKNIGVNGEVHTTYLELFNGRAIQKFPEANSFFVYDSPTLEKIIFWFLRKSVNLYGETFVKTFSKEEGNVASFEHGIALLKKFWQNKGIPAAMINFKDGSGLSPQNYVAAKAEVQALLYAQKQKYFDIFYEALPTINGTKMKSGTISASKAYAGFQKSKSGKTYVFSLIINNYSGGNINAQMFRVLDALK